MELTSPAQRIRPITPARTRTVIAATIGAVLEWYDLLVQGMFTVALAKQFFPTTDPSESLPISFGAFALVWPVGPTGAVVIGAYGDRVGGPQARADPVRWADDSGTSADRNFASLCLNRPGGAVTVDARPRAQGFSTGGEFAGAHRSASRAGSGAARFLRHLQWSATGLTMSLTASIAFLIMR